MVEAAEEGGLDMITALVNQIAVQGVISAEWKLKSTVNCYKEGSVLERENYRGLKITDQILNIAKKVLEMLMRQQVDTDEF